MEKKREKTGERESVLPCFGTKERFQRFGFFEEGSWKSQCSKRKDKRETSGGEKKKLGKRRRWKILNCYSSTIGKRLDLFEVDERDWDLGFQNQRLAGKRWVKN